MLSRRYYAYLYKNRRQPNINKIHLINITEYSGKSIKPQMTYYFKLEKY